MKYFYRKYYRYSQDILKPCKIYKYLNNLNKKYSQYITGIS